jgi:hypothetical protein
MIAHWGSFLAGVVTGLLMALGDRAEEVMRCELGIDARPGDGRP